MSSVNNVSGSSQVGIETFSFAGLSPEMMLAYMQSSMQCLDGQIAGILDDMNARRGQMAELNENIRQLRNLEARARDTSSDELDDDTQLDPLAAEQETALKAEMYDVEYHVGDGDFMANYRGGVQVQPSAETQKAAAELREFQEAHHDTTVRGVLSSMGFDDETIDSVTNEDGDIHADDFKMLAERLDSKLSELNDTTEYDSMRVGALMNKRSQMIQLTSNIMRDLNETSKAVIQNI